MEKAETYSFDDEEIHVLKEALAIYASFQNNMVMPMLVGDESDLEKVVGEFNKTQELFYHFFEEDVGHSFEEESTTFQEIEDRPMDFSDVSKFDFFEHVQED